MKISTRAVLIAVALLAAVGLQAAPAGAGDARGPACTDFDGGAQSYTTDDTPGSPTFGQARLKITSTFAAPSCADWDYTVYVLDSSGSRLLDSLTLKGDGTQLMAHRFVIAGEPLLAPETVCVYGESTKNGRTADRAPDGAGCIQVHLGDSGGQNWY